MQLTVSQEFRGRVAAGRVSRADADRFEAFVATCDRRLMRHPVITDNTYTRWFATGEAGRATVANLAARINAWWVMVVVFAAALVLGPTGTVVLYAILSFLALREFITLTPTGRGDHATLFWSFFVVLPLQYVLVGYRWYGLFAILIPVYAFLFVPTRSALAGDTTRFLERVAKIQWGLMIAVYCLSHAPALLMLALGLLAALPFSRDLNLLARGDLTARTLGVPVARLRGGVYVLAALATAVAVTTTGAVGFVGLVVPHLVRLAIGNDQRVLLPAAALAGGVLLTLADTLARTIVAPQQLPVGVLTALIGVPVFLYLLTRSPRGGAS